MSLLELLRAGFSSVGVPRVAPPPPTGTRIDLVDESESDIDIDEMLEPHPVVKPTPVDHGGGGGIGSGGGGGRGAGSPWPTWPVPGGGRLVLNVDTDSLAVHCPVHGSLCRIQQVLAKGPIGYLGLWMSRMHEGGVAGPEGMAYHMGLKDQCLQKNDETKKARQVCRLRWWAARELRPIFEMEALKLGKHVGTVTDL